MHATPHPGRRDEILDAAERRLAEVGYEAMTIAELINELGIAKGTFYHHFTSKEAVMTAVIERHTSDLRANAEAIADQPEVPAFTRLLQLLGGGLTSGAHADSTAERLAEPGTEAMHTRALDATLAAVLPSLSRILADAKTEGSIAVADPEASAAVLIVLIGQLIDRDVFGWCAAPNWQRLVGLVAAAEQLLGTQPGALAPLTAALAGEAGPA